jgi:hypothetical protein
MRRISTTAVPVFMGDGPSCCCCTAVQRAPRRPLKPTLSAAHSRSKVLEKRILSFSFQESNSDLVFPVHSLVTTLTELPSPSTATTVHTESLPITSPEDRTFGCPLLLWDCGSTGAETCSLQYKDMTLFLAVNLSYTVSNSGIWSSWPVQAFALLRCYAEYVGSCL